MVQTDLRVENPTRSRAQALGCPCPRCSTVWNRHQNHKLTWQELPNPHNPANMPRAPSQKVPLGRVVFGQHWVQNYRRDAEKQPWTWTVLGKADKFQKRARTRWVCKGKRIKTEQFRQDNRIFDTWIQAIRQHTQSDETETGPANVILLFRRRVPRNKSFSAGRSPPSLSHSQVQTALLKPNSSKILLHEQVLQHIRPWRKPQVRLPEVRQCEHLPLQETRRNRSVSASNWQFQHYRVWQGFLR